MDKIIERALSHWYAPEHELYGDPLPALMGIVGESGELCDLWKKKLYKPGYVFDRDAFLDELGDCLFYAAVLCHYDGITIEHIQSLPVALHIGTSVGSYVKWINYWSASWWATGDHNTINIVKAIEYICLDFNITLDQLSELNYAKLNERAANGDGYNRGNERREKEQTWCFICGQSMTAYKDDPHPVHAKCRNEYGKEKKEQLVICQHSHMCELEHPVYGKIDCSHREPHIACDGSSIAGGDCTTWEWVCDWIDKKKYCVSIRCSE